MDSIHVVPSVNLAWGRFIDPTCGAFSTDCRLLLTSRGLFMVEAFDQESHLVTKRRGSVYCLDDWPLMRFQEDG